MLQYLLAISLVFVEGLNMNKIYSSEADLSKELFHIKSCMMQLPRLKYMAYQAASFCRVYAYSCNNLWPEDLHSEIAEGTFCIINEFEQSNSLSEVTATRLAYQKVVRTIIEPFYSFLMDYFSFIPNGKSTIYKPCFWMGRDNFKTQFTCMIQNMKSMLSKGDVQPNLSAMSSEEDERLLQKVQNVTRSLELLEIAGNIVKEGGGPALGGSFKAPSDPNTTGIAGPLKSSLGNAEFKNSAQQGFVGPISKKYRFPWDEVQPGLEMKAVELTKEDPSAVCNDGSPAKMYMKQKSSTHWHFHIDGGFFCYDKASCLGRARSSTTLVSTRGWERSKANSGMFDPHLGGFPNYTHATIGYCSSDAWFGQVDIDDFVMVEGTTLPNGKNGTHFRGYTILQAVLKKFLKMGMGATPGQELFVSGCSAGSIAATAQADSWGSRLTTLAKGMNLTFHMPYIWSVLDGAPIVSPPAPGFYPGQLTIVEMAMKLVTLLYGPNRGTSPNDFINQGCVAKNALNPSICVWTATVLPYIVSRNIVLNMLWDNFVTGQIYFYFTPANAVQYSQGLHAVKMTRDVLYTVTQQQNYWVIGCGDHCISANPNFWRLMPATAPGGGSNVSARDMVIATRDGKTGQVIADKCDHYNCGCIGQTSAMTKLAAASLYLAVLTRLTGMMQNLPSPGALAIAAHQTDNPGQWLMP